MIFDFINRKGLENNLSKYFVLSDRVNSILDLLEKHDTLIHDKYSLNDYLYYPSTNYLLCNYNRVNLDRGALVCASLAMDQLFDINPGHNAIKICHFEYNGQDYKKMYPDKYEGIKMDYQAIQLVRLNYQLPFLKLENKEIISVALLKKDKHLELAENVSPKLRKDLEMKYDHLLKFI